MARKGKVGIDYFSHDVDILQDKKMKIIKAKHGLVGYAVYMRLLEEIYRENGYYIRIDEDFNILFSDENNLDYNVYILILNDCINKDLFSLELYENHNIITSKRVQENYFAATERRKEVSFIKEYLLSNPNDFYNTEKVNVDIKSLNVDINQQNDNIGTQSKKKVKRKEIKGEKKESKIENPSLSFNIDSIVSFWKEKRGDNVIVDSAITRMLSKSISEYGVDTIKGSIDKYDKALRGEEFWWSHTYSLFDFIQNGLVKFIHVSDDLSSMRKGEKKITPQDNCKESMSFDEMYQEVLKEKSMSNG